MTPPERDKSPESIMSDSSEAVALKPCPFCGGEAEFERKGTPRFSTIVRCTSCSCSLESGEEWDHGGGWNCRATPSPEDASPGVGGWRDIDSAPGNGLTFLAFAPHAQGGYCLVACRNIDGVVVDTYEGQTHPFTRWMPILALSTGEGREGLAAVDESAARKSAAPEVGATLEGCAGWLRDMAVNYREDAADLVGGMRNRMFAEADDCDRWAEALETAQSSEAPTIIPSEASTSTAGLDDTSTRAALDDGGGHGE